MNYFCVSYLVLEPAYIWRRKQDGRRSSTSRNTRRDFSSAATNIFAINSESIRRWQRDRIVGHVRGKRRCKPVGRRSSTETPSNVSRRTCIRCLPKIAGWTERHNRAFASGSHRYVSSRRRTRCSISGVRHLLHEDGRVSR